MSNDHETDLEKRSGTMLRFLNSHEFRREKLSRPFIVEVTGIPDSGKSTILTRIDVFLRRQGIAGRECRILIPQEGTRAVRNIPRSEIQHSIAASNYSLQILLEHSYSINYDVIFFDRCVYDAWCFVEWLHRKGRLKQEEADCFKSFFTHEGWLKNIDICFFVMCDPKTAIARNKKDAFLTRKTGIRTNPKTTAEFHSAFMNGYRYFKELGNPVKLIDTTNLDVGQASTKVLMDILECFEKRFK